MGHKGVWGCKFERRWNEFGWATVLLSLSKVEWTSGDEFEEGNKYEEPTRETQTVITNISAGDRKDIANL